jgi:hypothetical protein
MSNPIETFIKAVDTAADAVENAQQTLSADCVAAMEAIAKVVEPWCSSNHLSADKKVGNFTIQAANENLTVDQVPQTIGPDKILDLCKACHVAPEHMRAAAKRIAALIMSTVGRKGYQAVEAYNSTGEIQGTSAAVESLMPNGVYGKLTTTASLEAFGVNMDRVEPDLKTMITVNLLQFHTNLTHRVVPIQTVTQGNVTLVRETMDVYDLQDTTRKATRIVELYKNPAMVSIAAQRIKPLMGKSNKNAEWLVADDVYKFAKNINLFEMALDESKPGFDKYNHTDLIEDNIALDGVLLKVVYTDGANAKTFWRMLPISYARGHLTQFTNDHVSTDRRLALDKFPVRILVTDAADTKSGNTSDKTGDKYDALAPLEAAGNAAIALDLHVNAHVDRRTGAMDASAWVGFDIVGGTFADDDARKALKNKYQVTAEGYMMDARYNEDNKRKTSVRAEMRRRSQSYELPAGRNFVIDSAIGQDGVMNAAAKLAQLEHIGRDYNTLTVITETLTSVHDECIALGNDETARTSIADQYPAGDLVNPTVYLDTLDMSAMYGIRSADASGDTKQFLKMYFNRLTTELLQKSFLSEQLAEGAPVVFRVITSRPILGELFCLKHIHQHLETDSEGTGGIEHVVTLDNGVRLEIVTTTFDMIQDKIILIPYLANSQTSVLNFGQNFDQGTLVGSLSVASDGGPAYLRMFSCTRQIVIPFNPMGAIISVTGVTTQMGINDTNASLTVLGIVEA